VSDFLDWTQGTFLAEVGPLGRSDMIVNNDYAEIETDRLVAPEVA